MEKVKRGKMMYVPSIVIEQLEDLKQEEKILSRPEAFRSMAKYSEVGREIKRVMRNPFDMYSATRNRKKGGNWFKWL